MPEPLPLIRVMAIHALAYCERLFYLEGTTATMPALPKMDLQRAAA
jgi:hypothetical protein